MSDVKDITARLAQPFEPGEVKWKAQAVKGNRALAVAYVDARVIQDRLDDVLGVEGWQDEYQLLPDNSVMCRLRLKLGRRWITKMDVGSPSEQPDGGDRLKAAFSDALKRAAVKFGIGRFLYRLPQQWCDYDPAKKQFVSTPKLPAFALPGRPSAKQNGAPREDWNPPAEPRLAPEMQAEITRALALCQLTWADFLRQFGEVLGLPRHAVIERLNPAGATQVLDKLRGVYRARNAKK